MTRPARTRRTRPARAARRLRGALAGGAALLAGAAITAGTAALAADRPPGRAASESLPVTPAVPALVCPGPETLPVPAGGQAADPGAPVLVTALSGSQRAAAAATLRITGAKTAAVIRAAARPLPAGVGGPDGLGGHRGHGLVVGTDAPGSVALGALAATRLGPAVLTVGEDRSEDDSGPATDPLADLAAVQSTLARTGDLRGLAAVPCTAATADSWLVGGGTRTGERLRLLLVNPAVAAAVVDVTVQGPDGPVPAPTGEGVVVPPGAEVPLYVDSLAPGLARVAVHVSARSGRVVATLHDSRLDGLAPGGTDDVVAAPPAARQQVVPGVSLVDGFGTTASDPEAPGSTAVRIAVPGGTEAVARVRLLDSSGDVVLPRAAVVNVPAGGVVDVPVAGVASGTYTAVVDADVPVVVAARIGRRSPGAVAASSAAAEFAWAPAAPRLVGEGYAVLPPGTRSTVSLVATHGLGRVVVTEVHADGTSGEPQTVPVPDGTSATVQLSARAAAVRISGLAGRPLAGSVVSTATDARGPLITVLPLDLPERPRPVSRAVRDDELGLANGHSRP